MNFVASSAVMTSVEASVAKALLLELCLRTRRSARMSCSSRIEEDFVLKTTLVGRSFGRSRRSVCPSMWAVSCHCSARLQSVELAEPAGLPFVESTKERTYLMTTATLTSTVTKRNDLSVLS